MSAAGGPPAGRAGRPRGPYAPFVPRRGPLVAIALAVAVAAMSVGLALFVTGTVRWWDRAGFLVVGAAVVWFLYRQATVRAVPTPTGLTVRNLLYTRTVAWQDVVDVRYGGGRPWVQLELADGDVLAVMGVQRADGPSADAEAGRLATLAAVGPRGDGAPVWPPT